MAAPRHIHRVLFTGFIDTYMDTWVWIHNQAPEQHPGQGTQKRSVQTSLTPAASIIIMQASHSQWASATSSLSRACRLLAHDGTAYFSILLFASATAEGRGRMGGARKARGQECSNNISSPSDSRNDVEYMTVRQIRGKCCSSATHAKTREPQATND